MRILSKGFFLTVVCATTTGKSIKMERSGDTDELHFYNSYCLLKISLELEEANNVLQMRSANDLDGFKSNNPCIDPTTGVDRKMARTDKQSEVNLDHAIYANKGIKCFGENLFTIMGEYFWKDGGNARYNPSMYKVSRLGNAMRLFGLRNGIKLLSTDNDTVIARKFCYNVAYRAKMVKVIILCEDVMLRLG